MFLVVPIAAIVAATWRLVLQAIAGEGEPSPEERPMAVPEAAGAG